MKAVISTSIFNTLIETTKHCVAPKKETFRQSLHFIRLTITEREIKAQALDGFRASETVAKTNTDADGTFEAFVNPYELKCKKDGLTSIEVDGNLTKISCLDETGANSYAFNFAGGFPDADRIIKVQTERGFDGKEDKQRILNPDYMIDAYKAVKKFCKKPSATLELGEKAFDSAILNYTDEIFNHRQIILPMRKI